MIFAAEANGKIARMSLPGGNTAAELIASFRRGDKGAAKQLIQLFHPELRRLAADKMKGERSDHTWQPTALVKKDPQMLNPRGLRFFVLQVT